MAFHRHWHMLAHRFATGSDECANPTCKSSQIRNEALGAFPFAAAHEVL